MTRTGQALWAANASAAAAQSANAGAGRHLASEDAYHAATAATASRTHAARAADTSAAAPVGAPGPSCSCGQSRQINAHG